MVRMGLDYGLEAANSCIKQRFRWLFRIPNISASGTNSLPPSASARPNISFKEMEVHHVTETLYYPGKPDWKPIPLKLYDIKKPVNPVFQWVKQVYNACNGNYNPVTAGQFKQTCLLEMYDGCGSVLEQWQFENAWPQAIEFGELDMGNSEVLTVDLTLRYDRAFVVGEC